MLDVSAVYAIFNNLAQVYLEETSSGIWGLPKRHLPSTEGLHEPIADLVGDLGYLVGKFYYVGTLRDVSKTYVFATTLECELPPTNGSWVEPGQAVTTLRMDPASFSALLMIEKGNLHPGSYWPLVTDDVVFPDIFGSFGYERLHDVHTGVDLYCAPGTSVRAVETGTVVAVEWFTGPSAPEKTDFWNDTQAILVEGADCVFLYGEINTPLQVGNKILAGEVLGHVTPVLKDFKGRPMSMLHFECLAHGSRSSSWWEKGDVKPPSIKDPTAILMALAPPHARPFDLTQYDLVSYTPKSVVCKNSRWWALVTGESDAQFLSRLGGQEPTSEGDRRRQQALGQVL